MSNLQYAVFNDAKAYFDLVRGALGNAVDGEHFFECCADRIVYEVLYNFPGWPRIIEGKANLKVAFEGYCEGIKLHAADHLTKYASNDGEFVIIEYEVHGTVKSTGVYYNNRFCSIIKITDHKIVHWRDYMDSLAAWNTLTAKAC
ncbi:nuclear transport factor 2 family protein [Ralstonia solanacearum]|uniref:nuclear transport factor 2 family protein n=1 Tax=Ralstonia solanacearum TaxID=305 RepID=UPI0018D09DD7|nr:nuclear transport factor 2 family protein [Ralstonia solanacearum]